jgi:hypothetical protein
VDNNWDNKRGSADSNKCMTPGNKRTGERTDRLRPTPTIAATPKIRAGLRRGSKRARQDRYQEGKKRGYEEGYEAGKEAQNP